MPRESKFTEEIDQFILKHKNLGSRSISKAIENEFFIKISHVAVWNRRNDLLAVDEIDDNEITGLIVVAASTAKDDIYRKMEELNLDGAYFPVRIIVYCADIESFRAHKKLFEIDDREI